MNGAEFLDHVDSTLGLRALFGVDQVDLLHVEIPLGPVRMRVNGGPGRLLKVTGRRHEVYAPLLQLLDAPSVTVREVAVIADRAGAAEYMLERRTGQGSTFTRTAPRPVPAIDLLDHLAEWTVR